MKKSDFNGWKEVFSFSLEQGTKEKSFRIFLIVMFVIMLASTPVMTFMGRDKASDETPTEVETLLVYDMTGLPIDYEAHTFEGAYEKVQVKQEEGTDASFEAYVEKQSGDQAEANVAVKIEFSEEGYFDLTFVKPDSLLEEEDASGLVDQFVEFFSVAKLTAVDVTKEQYDFINREVYTNCMSLSSDGEVVEYESREGISMDAYSVLLGGIMVVTLIISFSGSAIATSIVTEKSTRVIEYLMINVRPMALLVGKILGSLTLTIIQFATIGVGYAGGQAISAALFGKGDSVSILDLLTDFSPLNLVIALIMIIVGVLCFCIIAGVAGASASKMEEMQEAMKLYQFAMIIGAYLGIFLCIMQLMGSGNDMLVKICCLIPISAPFIVPANLLTGNIGIGLALISIAIAAVTAAVLFIFAANVYEALIFHNGKVLKLKDIMGIAKAKKAVAGKEGK